MGKNVWDFYKWNDCVKMVCICSLLDCSQLQTAGMIRPKRGWWWHPAFFWTVAADVDHTFIGLCHQWEEMELHSSMKNECEDIEWFYPSAHNSFLSSTFLRISIDLAQYNCRFFTKWWPRDWAQRDSNSPANFGVLINAESYPTLNFVPLLCTPFYRWKHRDAVVVHCSTSTECTQFAAPLLYWWYWRVEWGRWTCWIAREEGRVLLVQWECGWTFM